MALIKCPECNQEVSDQSPKCIHCGYPIKNKNNEMLLSEKNERKRENSFIKVQKKVLWGICGSIVAVSLILGIYFTNLSPSARYKKAEAAFADGNYAKAMMYYKKAGDYEDSVIKLGKSKTLYYYTEGKNAIDTEEWKKGKEYLEKCTDYVDSADLILKCNYGLACQLLIDGNYEEAKVAFTELGSYEDSDNKIRECNYYIAVNLENEGMFIEAAEIYGDTSSYNDSDERIVAIGDRYLAEKNFVNALDVYKNLSSSAFNANKSAKYSDGQIKLERKDYAKASTAFKDAGDILDAKELYKYSTYEYAQSLLKKKQYSDAKTQFRNVSDYKDSEIFISSCDLMIAKKDMNNGNLNAAKIALRKLSPDISYDGINAADLLELLNKNSQWVDLCGKWTSTSGQMRSTQVGEYRDNWWYRDFESGDVNIEVRCAISDKGKVTLNLSGSIPIYTSYSTIGKYVETSTQSIDIEKKISSLGTIRINDFTSVTLSKGKITANYKKKDNNVDVYFNYVYKTDVTFGKRTENY